MYLFTILSVLNLSYGSIAADELSEKEAMLLNLSLDEYKERVENEKKILGGLKKLLNLRQREASFDEEVATQLVTENKNLSINKRMGNYDTVLYSIRADLVSIDEILQSLVTASGKRIIIDDDIDRKRLSSVISIYLENTPLVDIIDIIFGAKGLETIISENLIFVTLPAKLNVSSAYGYYQEKAIQTYQKVMIKYPKYEGVVRAYYELGNFYLASNFPSIALQEYKIVIANYPDHELTKNSMLNVGQCYEMLDDVENAKVSYLKYVNSYPHSNDTDDTYLKIGDLWSKQENYEKAIEVYKYIIKEYYDKDTAMFARLRLGNSFINTGDYDVALQLFLSMKKEFQNVNKNSELTENAHIENKVEGQSHQFQQDGGKAGDASLVSEHFIMPDKLRYELEYQIGNCCYLLGKYDEAIRVLKNFSLYEQNNEMLDKAYYKLADCFFMKQDYLTAFQLYKNALAEFPDSSLAPYGFYYSGKTLRKMKMLDNAIATLKQGLSKHKDSIYVDRMKFEIGLCYLDDENYKRSLGVFEELLEGNKDKNMSVKANIYAGVSLAQEKQHEKAIEYFQKALVGETLEKRKDWVSKLVGDSYAELGLLAEAVKSYQQ
ncbi:tetratricopeptide repeat protein [Candidatus Scalindua japonica]|uniref:tetratricopeptide repeat protein n=1 Tax=Candidatus Scalindua japonica TaxID=1284222 RepID=UPI0013A5909B|nr:tetratricopeptide repeat protein [Candidatus Scalindua japonica]